MIELLQRLHTSSTKSPLVLLWRPYVTSPNTGLYFPKGYK